MKNSKNLFAVFFVVGGLITFLISSNFMLKIFGLIAIMISPTFYKKRDMSIKHNDNGYQSIVDNIKKSYIYAILISLVFAFSFYLLHIDAVDGHKETFPVFFFAFSGLMMMGYWVFVTRDLYR